MSLRVANALGAVLIDNSLYFAAKAVLQGERLDGWSLLHLANFLQLLVFAEEIHLAPTHPDFWNPTERPDAIDQQLLKNCTDHGIVIAHVWDAPGASYHSLFEEALEDCKANLILLPNLNERRLGQLRTINISEVESELTTCRKELEHDLPTFFQERYAHPFNWNQQVAQLSYADNIENHPARGAANFLLRSSVAFGISQAEGAFGIPYSPHVQRLDLLLAKYQRLHMTIADQHIRTLEQHAIQTVEAASKASWLAGSARTWAIPVVLSFALQTAENLDEVIPCVLKLREEKDVSRFRKWLAQFVTTTSIANISSIQCEVEDSIELMREEMKRRAGKQLGEAWPVAPWMPVFSGLVENPRKEVVRVAEDLSKYIWHPLKLKFSYGHLFVMLRLIEEHLSSPHFLFPDDLLRKIFGNGLESTERQEFLSLQDQIAKAIIDGRKPSAKLDETLE